MSVSPTGCNIQDFGAAIDGTTSDTAAVNGALNAAGANGTVWFPYGSGNMVFSWLGVNGRPADAAAVENRRHAVQRRADEPRLSEPQ